MKDLIKKAKKFYQERRIFSILMIVCIVCAVITLIFLLRYFYFGTGKNSIRTCADIKESKQNEIVSDLETDEKIDKAKIRISDKSNLIFITVEFNSAATLVEAESKAVGIVEKFSDKEKDCYDLQFIIIQKPFENSDGFNVMGSLNSSSNNISWNNNNIKSETE